jgi:ribosomal protein L2
MTASVVNGTNYTKMIDPSSANILAPGLSNGRLRIMYDTYTMTAITTGSTIKMGKLPQGARVVAVGINHTTGATSFTLAIGNGGSGQSAKFSAAFAAVTTMTGVTWYMLPAAAFYTVGTLSGDDVMTLTTGGATGNTTQVVNLYTVFVTD